jgi:GNAT superfamily N-acetyltransferase
MTLTAEVQIDRWIPDASSLREDIDMLSAVLQACVHAGASVNFVLPFSHDDARAFWSSKVLPAVETGVCRVLVARSARQILGTVQLDLATPPNQPHRAEVRKLLVHPHARRRGIARALMLALEQEARELHRNLLTLDTVTGGFAEPLYLSLGYVKVGVIPHYAVRPDSPELDATTIMYKQLP